MSFDPFAKRSQNYGNPKHSKREQIIAESRAKRKQRKNEKKKENAASTIQKWFRMTISHKQTITDCRKRFDDHTLELLKQNSITFDDFDILMNLLKISLFGFTKNYSNDKLIAIDHEWFQKSVQKSSNLFLRIIKANKQKNSHFISHFSGDTSSNEALFETFKFICCSLSKHLQMTNANEKSIIMTLWSICDCNKWKYFETLSKEQKIKCQAFCYKLLKYLFDQTSFLSIVGAIFTRCMPLPKNNISENDNKTALNLLHTLVIRFFQFKHIFDKNNCNTSMNIDDKDDDDIDSKMTDNDNNKNEANDTKMTDGPINDTMTVSKICLHILSIPYYIERLKTYKLESVMKSFALNSNIWKQIILHFEEYCVELRASHTRVHQPTNNNQMHDSLWKKVMASFVDEPRLCYANKKSNNNNKSEQKENIKIIDVMNIPEYDDYDSDEESDYDDPSMNPLQAFMRITQEQEENVLNLANDNDNSNDKSSEILNINPNNNNNGMKRGRSKKLKNKRKRKRNSLFGSGGNVITELPCIVWCVHNLLSLCMDVRKFKMNDANDAKLLIAFLNISHITFEVMDLHIPVVFPYDNLDCQYELEYVNLFDKWCSHEILSCISSLIVKDISLSLDEYSIICTYLLQIIDHFPTQKEHTIWKHLGLVNADKDNNENKNHNLINALFDNVLTKYNFYKKKDLQSIIDQFFDAYYALSMYTSSRNRMKLMDEYNSCVCQLEECMKCIEVFELFLYGCHYELRIIDDFQFHEHQIPFKHNVWIELIESFKYLCYKAYWSKYHELDRFVSYFGKNNTKKKPLSPLCLLQIYHDKFEQFMGSVTSCFALLRDRNVRKSFTKNDEVWLLDQYIDLRQFEREILNSSVDDDKNDDDNGNNDIQMNPNNMQMNPNNMQMPNPMMAGGHGSGLDLFNPFVNPNHNMPFQNAMPMAFRQGAPAPLNRDHNSIAHQSTENLNRFNENFAKNDDNNGSDYRSRKDLKYRRSFLILIDIPFVIPFRLRVKLFYALIKYEKDFLESSGMDMRINSGNAIHCKIRRDNVLDDGYRGLNNFDPKRLKGLIQIEFQNKYGEIEAGIDGGGIFKEFLNDLILDAFDPERGLFLCTEYLNELYPNGNYYQFAQLMNIDKNYYEFLGKMVGKALYDQVLIEPIFSAIFLNKILCKHNYVDDLNAFDRDLYKQLMKVKHDYKNEMNVQDLQLYFAVSEDVLGKKSVVDLIVNGSDTLVNHENRHKYIHIFCDYKLNKTINDQSMAFMNGMSKVINLDYLRIFDSKELSKLLSGSNNKLWDVNDLRKHTVYSGGFHNGHRMMKWFWEILTEQGAEQRKKFLMFATSCSRPPLLGFKSLTPNFGIMCTGGDTTALPTSQTCMNLLKIPNYRDKSLFKKKLMQSINSNAGFDLS